MPLATHKRRRYNFKQIDRMLWPKPASGRRPRSRIAQDAPGKMWDQTNARDPQTLANVAAITPMPTTRSPKRRQAAVWYEWRCCRDHRVEPVTRPVP